MVDTSNDIKTDFLNELSTYISPLREILSKLELHTFDTGDLQEFHRLVHTVRGASSLVKLSDLSRIAAELENVIDDVLAQQLNLSTDVVEAIQAALIYFEACTKFESADVLLNSEVVEDVITHLQQLRLMSSVPVDESVADFLNDIDVNNIEEGISVEDILSEDEFLDPGFPDGNEDGLLADDADVFEDEFAECDNDDFFEMEDPFGEAEAAQQNEPDPNRVDLSEEDYDIELPQDELLEGFYQEAEEHFQDLGTALSELEKRVVAPSVMTSVHKELLRRIRRCVHTIKGAAAVIKLDDIAEWGHAFEDVLDILYEQTDKIDPESLRIVAESADMLEQCVASPQNIDRVKQDELKAAFAQMCPSSDVAKDLSEVEHDVVLPLDVFQEDAVPENDGVQKTDGVPKTAAPKAGRKAVRVDLGKIDLVAALVGELIIALSAFDKNMDNLAAIKNELERARMRLKTAARELEVGYEVKAIQHLGVGLSRLTPQAKGQAGLPAAAFSEFDLLELDRYSEFSLLIRSMNEIAVDVSTISTQLSDMHGEFDTYLNRMRILLGELQDKVMRVRMTPMANLAHRLRRTVRETALRLGKNVRLAISGEDIELDKEVWEKLADPLMHILRNAIDHGIEMPQQREQFGKSDLATILLTAFYQGNHVVIRITDDGAGLDYDAIRKRAAQHYTDAQWHNMSTSDLSELIFVQGFSTREDVTDVSGRGIGLDVVRDNIESLKGSVVIESSSKGNGTTFLIRIPLTTAVMRALIFEVRERLYASALYDIKEIVRLHPRDIHLNGKEIVRIGGLEYPFYNLATVLNPDIQAPLPGADQRHLVLIVDNGVWRAAIAIDHIHSQKEIVIKSLGTHLGRVKGLAGATITGEGSVIPILNLEELLKSESVSFHLPEKTLSEVPSKKLDILIVDDSVSVRTVVSRLMERQGWQVQTAKDGVEAVEKLHDYQPDLVVLDIEMPRMNGYEFMSVFRSRERFSRTPVIMLTSRMAQKYKAKAESLGVNGYMSKPYADEDFIAEVKKLTS